MRYAATNADRFVGSVYWGVDVSKQQRNKNLELKKEVIVERGKKKKKMENSRYYQ